MAGGSFVLLAQTIVCLVGISAAQHDTGKTISNESSKLDLVFLIHTSKSVKKPVWAEYKVFMKKVISGANIDSGNVRVGAALYRRRGVRIFPLNQYLKRADLINAIDGLRLRRGKYANLASGLNAVRQKLFTHNAGDRNDAPNAVVIITDRLSTNDTRKIIPSYQLLKYSGARIYYVGIGVDGGGEIASVATRGRHVFSPVQIQHLAKVKEAIVREEPALSTKVQEHDKVSTKVQEHDKAQKYSGSTTSRDSSKLDLVFLIHTSKGVKRSMWAEYKVFMKKVISGANIDSGDVRVGIALYRRRGVRIFPLNQYLKRADLINAIDGLRLRRGRHANLASGLNAVRDTLFTHNAGDRNNTPNAVVIITDRISTTQTDKIARSYRMLTNSGVRIYYVGIGVEKGGVIASIATPGRDVFFPVQAEDFPRVVYLIVKEEPALRRKKEDYVGSGKTITTAEDSSPPAYSGSLKDLGYQSDNKTFQELNEVDLVFLVHTSPKMSEDKYEYFKDFMLHVISAADIDSGSVQVGAVIYGSRGFVDFPLNEYRTRDSVASAIENLPQWWSSSASIAAGIDTARIQVFTPDDGGREGVPNLLIVLTDSVSTQDVEYIEASAELLKESDTRIYAVGIGFGTEKELAMVASSNQDMSNLRRVEELSTKKDALLRKIIAMKNRADKFSKPETPTHVKDFQQPQRSPEYWKATQKLDLVFLIHTSTKLKLIFYEYYKKFILDILNGANIDSGEVRVSVVIYRSTGVVVFPFNRYLTRAALTYEIRRLPLMRRSTSNIAAGMDSTRDKLFTTRAGDRQDVPNLIIVLTDAPATEDLDKIEAASQRLQEAGAKIFAVGISVDPDELKAIASDDDDVYTADDVTGLDGAPGAIFKVTGALQQRYPVYGR